MKRFMLVLTAFVVLSLTPTAAQAGGQFHEWVFWRVINQHNCNLAAEGNSDCLSRPVRASWLKGYCESHAHPKHVRDCVAAGPVWAPIVGLQSRLDEIASDIKEACVEEADDRRDRLETKYRRGRNRWFTVLVRRDKYGWPAPSQVSAPPTAIQVLSCG